MDDFEIHEFTTGAEWESWLETYHADRMEAWLRIRRVRADLELIAIGDALDGALCFGRIRPSGSAQIEAAKADGRWGVAYERQSTVKVPTDLENALEMSPKARAGFIRLGKSERYAVMLPLLKARTPEERERVLARVLNRLASAR